MFGRIREVFTKKYKKETEYREFVGKMLHRFELNNESEKIKEKVERLKNKGFISNFNL